MHRLSRSNELLDHTERLYQQYNYSKSKRSVRISLLDFPATASFAAVCDTLSLILAQLNPPIHLERLYAPDNKISHLPLEFLHLCGSHLRTLDLHNNHLTSMPESLASSCPNLEILDLSSNQVTKIPDSFLYPFNNLRILLIKDNKITHLPAILGEMLNLQTLTVSGNPLVFPTFEMINAMPGGINDLKAFLVSNSMSLESTSESLQSVPHKANHFSTVGLSRTQSLSDTHSRSLKASRRMGLVINSNKVTPDKAQIASADDTLTPSKPERKPLFPSRSKSDLGEPTFEAKPLLEAALEILTDLESSAADLHSISNSSWPPRSASFSGPPRNGKDLMSRDTEHSPDDLFENDAKPLAYFKRLSILREAPLDETSENGSHTPIDSREKETTPLPDTNPKREVTPPKSNKRKVSTSLQTSSSYHQTHNFQTPVLRPGTLHEKSVIVKVSRKILFSFSELHLSIKRFAGFCDNKKLSSKIVRLIHSSKEHIDDLVEAMEGVEDGKESQNLVVNTLHACIDSFKTILTTISENFAPLVARIDACFIRMVLLTLFGSLNELQNAHTLLRQSGTSSKTQPPLARNASSLASGSADSKAKYTQPSHSTREEIVLETPSISSATEAVATLEEIDERLYQTISLATANAQVVFSELTKTISKSALATANTPSTQSITPAVAAKFKELTYVCMTSMEITRGLVAKLSAIRLHQDPVSRRSFWDDINLFLKAVIQTFSAVKDIMRDAPIFNEVRRSMANLTKTTKELTIILEASSYKSISDALGPSLNNNMWHMSNGPPASANGSANSQLQMQTPPANIAAVRTPLEAAVGTAAAHALLPSQEPQFFHVNHNPATSLMPILNVPPPVLPDASNDGLHTAPVQSAEKVHAKHANPFDWL